MLRIGPSEAARLPEFRTFWEAAIAWQVERGVASHPEFPKSLIVSEIAAGRHFMALREDGECAGFFSVTLSDKVIWRERDRDDGIYIHRMCVNPRARGSQFAAAVFAWAGPYARSLGRSFVRMDTWADNPALVAYYQKCGFRLVGEQAIGHEPTLSSHYQGITLALFENPAS
jgi:GNAT superfamily N-acetyltransferase